MIRTFLIMLMILFVLVLMGCRPKIEERLLYRLLEEQDPEFIWDSKIPPKNWEGTETGIEEGFSHDFGTFSGDVDANVHEIKYFDGETRYKIEIGYYEIDSNWYGTITTWLVVKMYLTKDTLEGGHRYTYPGFSIKDTEWLCLEELEEDLLDMNRRDVMAIFEYLENRYLEDDDE